MDKAGWQKIIENEYRMSDTHDLGTLTDDLLDYLDSSDAELRDTIAYSVFARWIISHQYYTEQQMVHLVNLLIPKLSQSLGDYGDDTVFGRSYAALVLSLLAYQEDRMGFMTDALVHALLDEACNYLIAERDHRAHIEGKGWANACSHTADLLKFLARNPLVQIEDAKRIMDTIAGKVVMQTEYIYHHDEDERLAQVVMAVIDLSLLTTYDLGDWLTHFRDWNTTHSLKDEYNPIDHATYQNIKNFLRSLYLQMQLVDSIPIDAAHFEPELLNTISEFSL
jgi:Protein of unknown function (DUF2785)